jgi:type-F conjugative transfer system protein TraW
VRRPACSFRLSSLGVPAAEARDYGQQGAVFPVIERDLLEQIHTRLTAMEKSGETQRLNQELKRRTAARVNRPEPVAGLVRASAARRWSFDPTITLETDIRGAKGELIHARGTRVNPLDSVPLRAELLFFDGDDPDQLAWALSQSRAAKLILTKRRTARADEGAAAALLLRPGRQADRAFRDQGAAGARAPARPGARSQRDRPATPTRSPPMNIASSPRCEPALGALGPGAGQSGQRRCRARPLHRQLRQPDHGHLLVVPVSDLGRRAQDLAVEPARS